MAEACTIRPNFLPRFAMRRVEEKKHGKATVIVGPAFPPARLDAFIKEVYPKRAIEFLYHGDPKLQPVAGLLQNTHDGRKAQVEGKPVMALKSLSKLYGDLIVHVNYFDVNDGQIVWWTWKPEENSDVAKKGIP